MTSENLSAEQAHALFDILTHCEVYNEIRGFRFPGALSHSGHPFKIAGEKNDSPLVYSLFSKFVLPLPGIKDVSSGFWQTRIQGLVDDLAKAELSEAYEKGNIGIRKTLATAVAAVAEGPGRGVFGGLPPKPDRARTRDGYDSTKPDDVAAAWEDFTQQLVYGDLLDELFAKAGETDKLENHSTLVQAAHEHVLITIASFMHYILIVLPEGQTMLSMIKRANNMVPYFSIRQTLKIGNVATMINGLVNIVLAKLSMNTVTTMLGMTDASDQGMNLLQTIISTVLGWDISELKKRSSKIEKGSDAPSKAQLETIRAYVGKSRDEHDKCRTESEVNAEPIVIVVLRNYDGPHPSEKHLPKLQEYLLLHLSIRDRRQIIDVLCKRQPDLLTQTVRDFVEVYEPVIRRLHDSVDLSATVADFEKFLNDLLKVSRPASDRTAGATVLTYVHLLRRHQASSHRFLHQVTKNGKELSQWYKDYTKNAVAQFRQHESMNNEGQELGGAGTLTTALSQLVRALPLSDQDTVEKEVAAHSAHLKAITAKSSSRMKLDVAADRQEAHTDAQQSPLATGPGTYLARWNALIDATTVTPLTLVGGLRSGADASVRNASRLESEDSKKASDAEEQDLGSPPTCDETIRLLLPGFKKLLQEKVKV